MKLPVSVKGVLLVGDQALLLRNERGEWELPGGRVDAGETQQQALIREFREELAVDVEPVDLIDSYEFEVIPSKRVRIVTFGCRLRGAFAPQLSAEHAAFGLHALEELARLPLPEGYRRSIEAWSQRDAM